MDIKRVGVVGLGLMGSGIAQVAAQAGYQVLGFDISAETVDASVKRLQRVLKVDVRMRKGQPSEVDETMARIATTTSLQAFGDCDLVIEAAPEILALKQETFRTLDGCCRPEAILASNTSTLSVTEIARSVKKRDRFVGMHFFSPVPMMKLLEVIRTIETSDEACEAAKGFGVKVGKTVIVLPDTPGFVVNALLIPYMLDAIRLYERGVASKEDIDTAMELGCGHPMGPFKLLDNVGLDTAYHICDIMFRETKDPRFSTPVSLRNLYLAGHYGKKTKRGFYQHGGGQ